MTDFGQKRSDVIAKRAAERAAWEALYTRKELLQLQQIKIRQRLTKERLPFLPDTDEDQQRLLDLQDGLVQSQKDHQKALEAVQSEEAAFDALGKHSDMVEQLLNGRFPVLMLPLRVQTRFVTVKHLLGNLSKESIFDISKEAALTPLEELKYNPDSAKQDPFLIPTYQTLKNGAAQEANWARELGRELGNNNSFAPEAGYWEIEPDAKELWVRIYPDDIFVHGHEPHLSPAEKKAGEEFWQTWANVHENNPNALEEERSGASVDKPLTAAWTKLQFAYRYSRAAWIVKATKPNQLPGLKSQTWTEALRSFVMPDKFVVTLFQGELSQSFEGKRIPHPLRLSPNPEEQATVEQIKWVADFEEAEQIGMAIRIPLPEIRLDLSQAFEKLVVVGVKATADEVQGKELLENLLENHQYCGSGLSILPQGTPTNNFENIRSGYSEEDLDADKTFSLEFGDPQFGDENSWKDKKDGRYLAGALGISPAIFQRVPGAETMDIGKAIAMNRLLWPATMGYYLQQFFQPLISESAIEKTKAFFFNHVCGRGLLPVFRIGKQPYGILPTTNFSRWAAGDQFSQGLFDLVLQPLNNHWAGLSKKVQQIIVASEAEVGSKFSEEFIRILGLSASSEAYYHRPQVSGRLIAIGKFAQKTEQDPPFDAMQVTSRFFRPLISKELDELELASDQVNWFDERQERIFHQHFSNLYQQFSNNIIDDLMLSEKRQLSKVRVGEQELNYLQWLRLASYQDLQAGDYPGFDATQNKPGALLYLLARQAISRHYLQAAAALIPNLDKTVSTIDFALEHLTDAYVEGDRFGAEVNNFLSRLSGKNQDGFKASDYLYNNNKWAYLSYPSPKPEEPSMGDFLENRIKGNTTQNEHILPLLDAKHALALLEEESTAGLHRLFSEHLDTCSYRLDSWMLGLVHQRLTDLRSEPGQAEGIYLGAYGYLEHIAPQDGEYRNVYRIVSHPRLVKTGDRLNKNKHVIPVFALDSVSDHQIDIDSFLANSYVYLGKEEQPDVQWSPVDGAKIIDQPKVTPGNQGFIHTPSQAHAITAAILRSGYLAGQSQGEITDDFAVNLSSARVRKALYYLDGIRNGQGLPALLGYQFERFLHNNAVPYLDAYLLQFRRAFPLSIDQDLGDNQQELNVVHGLNIVNVYQARNQDLDEVLKQKGIDLSIPDTEDTVQLAAKVQIKAAIEQLIEQLDAIGDLMLAESIYKLSKGDLESADAALKALSNDKEIDMPEIIRTPPAGKPLSHVLGVQFDLKSEEKIWAGVDSPRSLLNPGLNRWLYQQLPASEDMCFNVEADGQKKIWSMRNLLLQPIDLIYSFQEGDPFSETSALTYYIKKLAIRRLKLPPGSPVRVHYQDQTNLKPRQRTLPELKPLFLHLLETVNNSRPLFPTDLQLPADTRPLEGIAYERLTNEPLLKVFSTFLDGRYKHSLYKVYHKLKTRTDQLKAISVEDISSDNTQTLYDDLLDTLYEPSHFNVLRGDYPTGSIVTGESVARLIEQAGKAYVHFEQLKTRAKALFNQVKKRSDKKKQWEGLEALARLIFGSTLKLMPVFSLANPGEIQAATDFPDLLADAGEAAVSDWLRGVALVREKVACYSKQQTLSGIITSGFRPAPLKIIQLPFQTDAANYRWLGTEFRPDIQINGNHLSLAMEWPGNYDTSDLQSGMIIDSWTERIQESRRSSAIAFHYDQANAEPPQNLLLCVSPELTGQWKWEDLVGCVVETMEMAKKRAVEPELFEEDVDERNTNVYYMFGHPLKFILPALSIPVSNTGNTPSIKFDEQNVHF